MVEQWFRGQRWFVIQDPLAGTHFYLTEQEHAVLAQLDGQTSTAEIQSSFERHFAPRRLDLAQLRGYLSQLHRAGLVLGEAIGQGEQLAVRRQVKQSGPLRWLERFLAMRFRGFDPGPLLDWLMPRLGWTMGPIGFCLWLVALAAAAMVTLARIGELPVRAAQVQAAMTPASAAWLGVALMLVKTLHELGHALAARRQGCRVREMGVQLFFLLPCLYTNVSEAWLVPGKWRRIAISAAGIYVELFLASVALILWWLAEPGPLASVCLGVVAVASIGTLVLNGNPLMRYDGYYILADLVEIPNLEERSRRQLLAWLARWGLGIDWRPGDTLDERRWPLLAAYAAAAFAYRAVVIVGMYFAARLLLRPWRLEPLADMLAAVAAVGLVAPLAAALGQLLMQPSRRREIRPLRLALSAGVLAALVAAVLLVPLPQRVVAPAVIEPREPAQVYVTVAGTLTESTPVGTLVKKGDPIARLENLELARDRVRLTGERWQQAVRLTHLETARGSDPASAAAIPAAREALADLDARLAQLELLISRLTLVAPSDGLVLPPPQTPAPPASAARLAAWSGTPLDAQNVGSFLETGTLVAVVARPGDWQAVAIVEQADVPLVQNGAAARIVLPGGSGGSTKGEVVDIARRDADELPLHLVAAGMLPAAKDSAGRPRPGPATYEVRIALANPPRALLPGNVGWVSLAAPPEPLGQRLAR
jgi:putative peptide zinc metalloprotease protein